MNKNIVISKLFYIDAEKLAKERPKYFEVPEKEELDNLAIGHFIKVCTGGERFWVIVTLVSGNYVWGTINNNLVRTEHGLKDGDLIQVEKKNIYDIDEPV